MGPTSQTSIAFFITNFIILIKWVYLFILHMFINLSFSVSKYNYF